MRVSGVVVIRLSDQGSEWLAEAERRRASTGPHTAFTWWLATDENGGPLEGPDGEVEERVFEVLRGSHGSLTDDLILVERPASCEIPEPPFSHPEPIESFRLDGARCHVYYRPPRPQDPPSFVDAVLDELIELSGTHGFTEKDWIDTGMRLLQARDPKSEN